MQYGIKFSVLGSKHSAENVSYDMMGHEFISGLGNTDVVVRASADLVSEDWASSVLEFPLRLALQTSSLYANVGVAFAQCLSLSGEYSYASINYAITEVPSMGIVLPQPLPTSYGGEHTSVHKVENSLLPSLWLLSLEAGYISRFDGFNAISIGIIGRYAFASSSGSHSAEAFSLNDNSVSTIQPSVSSLVTRIGYYEVGLRIAYHIGFGSKGLIELK